MNDLPQQVVDILTTDRPIGQWTEDQEKSKTSKMGELIDADFFGMPGEEKDIQLPAIFAVGAPIKFSENVGNILLGTIQTGLREWEVSNKINNCLIIRDIKTGKTINYLAHYRAKRAKVPKPSQSGPMPENPQKSTVMHGADLIDISEKLAEFNEAQFLSITAVNYDWVSNVELVKYNEKANKSSATDYQSYHLSDSVGEDSLELTGHKVTFSANYSMPDWLQENDWVLPVTLSFVQLDEKPIHISLNFKINPAAEKRLFFTSTISLKDYSLTEGVYQVYILSSNEAFGPFKIEL